MPIIEAAIDETREELTELWARLLAAALDPKRKNLVRADLVMTMKQLEPLDAAVLRAVYETQTAFSPNARDELARRFDVSEPEITVSFQTLERIGCFVPSDTAVPNLGGIRINPSLAPRGRLLMQAVS